MSENFGPLTIPSDDLTRLTQCQHHDPHSFYGWHKIDDGHSLIRTRQLGAEKVVLETEGASIDLQPLGDDIWGVVLDRGDSFDYRFQVTWPGGKETTTADP